MTTPDSKQPAASSIAPAGQPTWYYAIGTHQIGPLDHSSFISLIHTGSVRADTPVWTVGMERWSAAGGIPRLATALQAGLLVTPSAPPVYPGMVSRPATIAPDAGLRWLIPVGRSGYCIIAGYFGIFSLVGIFGPFALLFGILGLRETSRQPGLLGRGRAWFGVVMGVLATLGMIAFGASRLI